jgi:hypothetical protein
VAVRECGVCPCGDESNAPHHGSTRVAEGVNGVLLRAKRDGKAPPALKQRGEASEWKLKYLRRNTYPPNNDAARTFRTKYSVQIRPNVCSGRVHVVASVLDAIALADWETLKNAEMQIKREEFTLPRLWTVGFFPLRTTPALSFQLKRPRSIWDCYKKSI